MKTLIRTCLSPGCQGEVPEAFGDDSLCLEHYVAEATQDWTRPRTVYATGGASIVKRLTGCSLKWILSWKPSAMKP